MVTININLPTGAGQKANIETIQETPFPTSSAGKEKSTQAFPSPQSTTHSSALPSPVLKPGIAAHANTETPGPGIKNTKQTGVPSPKTQTPETQGDLPQPGRAGTEKASKGGKYPTPKDSTSLAQQVNKEIGKAEKPSSRSRSSKTRTKKK